MGLIIAELQDRQPNLPYFDPNFTGEYPAEPPFTLSDLEELYPAASARKKEDEAFAQRAHTATFELQQGRRGYRAHLAAHHERVPPRPAADLRQSGRPL